MHHVYYPNTTNLSDAVVLALGAGEQRTINFSLPAVTTTTVSGRLTLPVDVSTKGIRVRLVNLEPAHDYRAGEIILDIAGVPPGSFTLADTGRQPFSAMSVSWAGRETARSRPQSSR